MRCQLKRLIFLGQENQHVQRFLKRLCDNGWQVTCINDIHVRRYSSSNRIFDVGILLVDEKTAYQRKEIENIMHSLSREWIAVVEKSSLENNVIKEIIVDISYAYHILSEEIEELIVLVEHIGNMISLKKDIDEKLYFIDSHSQMIGSTQSMKKLFCTIKKVASIDAPVFINGESGTGKELTARSIHEQSSRSQGPFNAINCGALPAHLIQSELFGYEKGAFTGAARRKMGIIESTAGGTLLLDEIGDLPQELQVNLLRFLENSCIQRVGGISEIAVDVRVLSATHVNIEEAVRAGHFREDLYHRLNVLQITIPPLREREDDIEQLAHYFFQKFSEDTPTRARGFSQESLIVMRQYEWPGNIRELINHIRRAMLMCESALITPADLGLERRCSPSRQPITLEQVRCIAEREAIKSALARNRYRIQQTASDLEISRVTLYRLMEKHQIFRQEQDDTPPSNQARILPMPLPSLWK